MIRFTKEHKQLSKYPWTTLKNNYSDSERALNEAAIYNNIKAMNKAMKVHQKYEYALLYKKIKLGRYLYGKK